MVREQPWELSVARDENQSQALDTIQDYVTDARVLLQDSVSPYRYEDTSLVAALNFMLLEARRLRADLFIGKHGTRVPYFATVDDTQVDIEPAFRLAFLYGMVGHALQRDQEDIEDSRASSFLAAFNSILNGTAASSMIVPPGGGVPAKRAQ
jgi:hypothetical protein